MKDIKKYQWKNRVIILKDKSSETPTIKKARERLQRQHAELAERDVIILEDKAPDFQIELYGKDGGKKWESEFTIKEIVEKIDSMPMRQDEMKGL